jgi:choice-of-anchor A domain-containing protein
MATSCKLIRALLAFSAFAVPAQATSFGPFSCSTCGSGFDASAFNVVTLGTSSTISTGNFNPNSDIGGRIAVFGNYTGNGYAIDSQANTVPNNYTETYALIVNGSITTNAFTLGNGSASQEAFVGGTYTNFNSPKPTVVTQLSASDFDFYAARTSLQNLSASTLANYSTAVTATPQSNGTNYVLSPSGSGFFVYNVNYSYFTNQNLAFEVDVVTGQSVVINVVGAPANLTLSKGTVVKYNGVTVNANTTGGVPVLFNLPEVTTLSTSNGAVNGSILAPFATFESPNQTVDGQIFVASVNGLAETHDQYYNGTLPSLSGSASLAAVPEPSTFMLIGCALLAIGLLRGKRDSANLKKTPHGNV